MQLQHYLQSMQNDGHWGTDVEIIAAANLFNCSIMCLSRYGSSHSLCIQHFSPHSITSATCGTSCDHQVIYLVNSSGNHYELAQVSDGELKPKKHKDHSEVRRASRGSREPLYPVQRTDKEERNKTWKHQQTLVFLLQLQKKAFALTALQTYTFILSLLHLAEKLKSVMAVLSADR